MIKMSKIYTDGTVIVATSLQGRLSCHWILKACRLSGTRKQNFDIICQLLEESDLDSPAEMLPTWQNPFYLRDVYKSPVREVIGSKNYRAYCRRADIFEITVKDKSVSVEKSKENRPRSQLNFETAIDAINYVLDRI